MDTLDNMSDQQTKELNKAVKSINEQISTNVQRLDILKTTSEKQIHGLKDKLETVNG